MTRVIAIATQKGGVGKSTISGYLALHLARQGEKVLVLDADPQGNTTERFCGDDLEELLEEHQPTEFIDLFDPLEEIRTLPTPSGIDLIPTRANELDLYTMTADTEEELLTPRRNIKLVLDRYDAVIIDCPPSLGPMMIAALTMAKDVFSPIKVAGYSLSGLSGFIETCAALQQRTNPELVFRGIVINMLHPHKHRARDMHRKLDECREAFGDMVLSNVLYERPPIDTGNDLGCSLEDLSYAHKAAREMRAVMDEMIARSTP